MEKKLTTSPESTKDDKGGTDISQSRKQEYIVMVDRTLITFDVECATGKVILERAGKVPFERFQLNQRLKGGKVEKVGYDQKVCFSDPGLEKFMTIPLDQTEG
jgi:hypothetical protein